MKHLILFNRFLNRKTKTTILLIGLFLLFPFLIHAQQSQTHVFEDWVTFKGTQDMYHHSKTITDSQRNVYVVGSSINADGNYDIMVVKYNRKGTLIWEDQINGSANGDDYGTDLILDNSSHLIVTGTVFNTGASHDMILRKYQASNGNIVWTKNYNSSANLLDGGTALAVSPTDDIFVGGGTSSITTQTDFLIMKYNSSGTQQWVNTYDYINYQEVVTKIEYNGSTVLVTGASESNPGKWEMTVFKVNVSNGAIGSSYRTGGNAESIDKVTDIIADDNGDIYVVGAVENLSTGYDMKIVKLDENLNLIWSREINGVDNLNDEAHAVQVDGNYNVYVTGFITSSTTAKDYYTCKYNSSGTQQWNVQHDGVDHGDDYGKDLILDAAGNIYVTGTSSINGTLDYYTVKYKYNGTILWDIVYNSYANANDQVMDITLDDNEDVIVVGQVDLFGTTKYATVKYIQKGLINIPDDELIPNSSYFIENKGQLKTNTGSLANSIRFYNAQCSPAMFISNTMMSMQFFEETSDTTSHEHRVDFTFNKGNTQKKIYSIGGESKSYTNFSGGSISNFSRDRVSHLESTYSPEVWTNIDMVYSTNNKGPKIYYICKQGFNANNINMEITGHDGLSIDVDGNLVILNSVSDLKLLEAEVYQVATNGTRIDLNWSPTFSISGNYVSLNLGAYNTTQPLIVEIDKGENQGTSIVQTDNLFWSTYFGGNYIDRVTANETDGDFLWIAGESNSGEFLQLPGEIEQTGSQDLFVAKFNLETAHLEWISAVQGNTSDYLKDIAINNSNDHCFIVGWTSSNDLINLSSVGMNDVSHNGSADGYIIEFKDDGTRPLSTLQSYIGGSDEDRCQGVAYQKINEDILDPRIFIVGLSESAGTGTFPIMTESGAFNDTTDSGFSRGFIMKLKANYENEWCTYFASNRITDVAVSPTSVFVCGRTWSTDVNLSCDVPPNGEMPICNSNGISDTTSVHAGNTAHFVAEFEHDQLVWSTYVGGRSGGGFGQFMEPHLALLDNGSAEELYFSAQSIHQDLTLQTSLNGGNYNLAYDDGTSGYICRYTDRVLTWKTFLSKDYGVNVQGLSTYNYGNQKGVAITGSYWINSSVLPLSSNCQTPDVGEIPFCDFNGNYYTETGDNSTYYGSRMFIMLFNNSDELLWSTVFGSNVGNRLLDAKFTEDNLIVVGYGSKNTLEEFDVNSSLDYYRTDNTNDDNESTTDGTIAMFEISDIFIGVEEFNIFNSLNFEVSPNPFSKTISITSLQNVENGTIIKLYNSLGQLILNDVFQNGNRVQIINTPELESGIYYLEITNKNDKLFSTKIIKQ